MKSLLLLAALTGTARAELAAGGELEVIPNGNLVAGQDTSLAVATTVAFAGLLGVRTPVFSIGFAPRYVPSMHAMLDAADTFSQLDIGIQLAAHVAVDPKVELFAFATPAYSFIYDNRDGSSGLAVAFGGGAGYAIAPRLLLAATLGYDFGMQTTNEGATAATRLLTLGIGVQFVPSEAR